MFRLDPARLLDDQGDRWAHEVRLAAAIWISEREADEARKAEAAAKAKARSR